MRLTGPQAVAYCRSYDLLEEVALDNDRGMAALDTREPLLGIVEKFQQRQKAIQKERVALIKALSADAAGNIQYQNPDEKDETKRVVLFRDVAEAEQRFEEWLAKAVELDAFILEAEIPLLPADFFNGLTVQQKIRTAFKPFLAKANS